MVALSQWAISRGFLQNQDYMGRCTGQVGIHFLLGANAKKWLYQTLDQSLASSCHWYLVPHLSSHPYDSSHSVEIQSTLSGDAGISTVFQEEILFLGIQPTSLLQLPVLSPSMVKEIKINLYPNAIKLFREKRELTYSVRLRTLTILFCFCSFQEIHNAS